MVFETFFGNELIGANKTTVPTSTLEGKTVLIYFSAHWCGPCRMFTPALSKFYTELKEKRQDFELVFASSDRDQAAFDEYFGEMPWLALPFSERALKEKLSKKYKVRGIPTLVVVDKDGNLITTNGRAQVAQDPQAANFPWVPPTLAESLGTTFLNQEKKEVTLDIKGKGKVIGLYFSAHWCPPCKRFTPILTAKYKELKAEGKDLEIIYVSSDHDAGSFDEYFGEMPWIAVPFSDTKRRTTLGEIFEIEGIPSLIFLDGEDLSTISTNGVSAVSGNLPYPFNPPALSTLTGDTVSEINESPALVIFADPAKVDEITALVKPVAEEFTQAKKGVIFYVAGDHPVVSSVRDFAKVSQDTPQIILLDVPGQSKYLPESKEVTPEYIRTFVNGFLQETLKGVSLRS